MSDLDRDELAEEMAFDLDIEDEYADDTVVITEKEIMNGQEVDKILFIGSAMGAADYMISSAKEKDPNDITEVSLWNMENFRESAEIFEYC